MSTYDRHSNQPDSFRVDDRREPIKATQMQEDGDRWLLMYEHDSNHRHLLCTAWRDLNDCC